MAFALLLSLAGIALNALGLFDLGPVSAYVAKIDFSGIVLHGMLSVLLFAGALHINLAELKDVKLSVGILATIGVLISTIVIGTLTWYAANLCGLQLPYLYALVFGALISPIDPIAVLGILKEAGISKSLYVKIGGESLFNDGVGVVVFVALLGIASSPGPVEWNHFLTDFLREGLGGLFLGIALGWITYRLLRSIDDYKVEMLLTLALVLGGYTLAEYLHVSAPICMVAAGLVIGNHGRDFGMSDETRKNIDIFWELLDEIFNAILFLLIGLELVIIPLSGGILFAGALTVVAVLIGRLVSVGIPISIMRLFRDFDRGTIRLMTWGGLRGGISIALALALPAGPEKEIILPLTYIAVLFSILVQGLTFSSVIRMIKKD